MSFRSFTLLMLSAVSTGILFSSLYAQTTLPLASVPSTAASATASDAPINFDDFFINKALRLEIYQVGNHDQEIVSLNKIYEEPIWPENPRNVIAPFDACRYDMKVYDLASGRLLFVHPFDGLFGEYRTTDPAIKGIQGVYPKSLRIPEPKKPVRFVIENRDKKLHLKELYSLTIRPDDYHIIRENVNQGDVTFVQQKTGDPHDKVDLAFLAEGYLAADQDKFKNDVAKMTTALFSYEPYKSNKDRFNIYGVFRASPERGMDEPVQHGYKTTALGATYNTFDTDRYLTIQDDHAIYRMAAQVPFDTAVVLVNTA
ncbi:MAG TPA: M64 family metallopeptidase, partial [Phycisphaerae bacterium]